MYSFRQICNEIMPPVLMRILRSAASSLNRTQAPAPALKGKPTKQARKGSDSSGVEQPPDYYDAIYDVSEKYLCHYSQVHYYGQWCVVADRMLRSGATSILDIGCGPGQFSALLRDRGIKRYLGLDFSASAIARAKVICPEFDFQTTDVFQTNLLREHDYDCVFCGEFLEHVERDLDVIRLIRPGTRMYGSVPNFPDPAHVRVFRDSDEVAKRYGPLFNDFTISEFGLGDRQLRFYVFEGIRNGEGDA